MANCKHCKERRVFNDLCSKHFIARFEKRVAETIRKFNLIDHNQKICVAVSGGKDSLSLLYLLNKLGYSVVALSVDEGISGYRDRTLEGAARFCKESNIPIEVVSFEQVFGKRLDSLKSIRPCSVCGVFRRQILNRYSKAYDAIATGHNLDDEAQAIVMNLLKGNLTMLARAGPASGIGPAKGFTRRVKPFYFAPEKEVMAYSLLVGLSVDFEECPLVSDAFRLKVRDGLNELESEMPGAKRNIVDWFIKSKGRFQKGHIQNYCTVCGEPSSGNICNACMLVDKLKTKAELT